MNAGSQLVAACESAWDHIRRLNPEVGESIVVIGSGGRRASRLLGHFIAEKWELQQDDGRIKKVHEVLLVAENLRRSGPEVFTTLLHESVHALAHARQIKDVSGQRHNKRFARLCVEMGLEPPAQADKTLGFSAAILDANSKYLYANDIYKIEQALKICRSMQLAPKAQQTSFKAECACGRTLRVGKRTIEEGPLLCGLCEELFNLMETD